MHPQEISRLVSKGSFESEAARCRARMIALSVRSVSCDSDREEQNLARTFRALMDKQNNKTSLEVIKSAR
jgi:hypothetical protein